MSKLRVKDTDSSKRSWSKDVDLRLINTYENVNERTVSRSDKFDY